MTDGIYHHHKHAEKPRWVAPGTRFVCECSWVWRWAGGCWTHQDVIVHRGLTHKEFKQCEADCWAYIRRHYK